MNILSDALVRFDYMLPFFLVVLNKTNMKFADMALNTGKMYIVAMTILAVGYGTKKMA